MISTETALVSAWLCDQEDDAPRLILADFYADHGDSMTETYLRLWSPDEQKDGYGDGGCGDGGYGYGGGYGGGGYGGDGDGGYGYGGYEHHKKGTTPVKDGLYILCIKGTNYPYVLVGWVRVFGIELTVRNGRILRRFGDTAALSNIAKKGPQEDTEILDPSDEENIWRPNVSRAILCNEKAWKNHIKTPKQESA